MKKRHMLSAMALTLVAGSMGSTASAEPSVTDYKEATSSYEEAYINGFMNLNGGNQDQTSYDVNFSADYERVFSSPDSNTKLEFYGNSEFSRGPNAGDDDTSYYDALGSATFDRYFQPGSNGAFWYGKLDLGVRKDMENPFSQVTAGLGYGRVVNVTPMARAIRVIQELRKRGSLTGDPADEIYQSVAEIISKEDEYRSKYGSADYEQYWIEDIEKALMASGMAKGSGSLGAGAILKSYDVLVNERISTRKKGWLVRGGAGIVISDYDGDAGDPVIEVGAEYHVPFGNKTQFSEEASVGIVLDNNDDNYVFSNAMTLTYEFTDRVDWENAWLFSYNESEVSNDVTTNILSSTFRYYLTNSLDLNLTAFLRNVEDNIDNNGNDEWDSGLQLGLQYRLK